MALNFPTSFYQKDDKQKKNIHLIQFAKRTELNIGQLNLDIPGQMAWLRDLMEK